MNTFKDNEQNSLQAKELQKFFNKVKGVMLIPKDSKMNLVEYPVLCLVLSKEQYMNFKDYGLNKIVLDLLDDKYPILSIRAEEKSNVVGLSITDIDSGLTFKLPDQPMGEALLKFLQTTKYDDKITLMLGFFNNDNLAFENDIKSNVLLILDGYFFE